MLSTLFADGYSLRRVLAGVALVSAFSAPSLVSAQSETFETKGYSGACRMGGGDEIGYIGDKEWVGFRALDLNNYRNTCGFGLNNGYGQLGGAVGNVLGLGATSAFVHSVNPFVLNSMVAGAGWQNPTSLFMQFYLGGVLKSTTTLSLGTAQTGLAPYTGFYSGATDFIMFTPKYPPSNDYSKDVFGSHNVFCPQGSSVECTGRYESWFVDNLSFSAATVVVTPEPASVAMIGVGLVAVALVRRKRRA